ncbi:hypothetical protein CBR_g25963 [Chara braunii]|uniref:Uncharacterized protein n=1 Tax=Chara braunii TaxID=69332 RepID=A0A388L6X5_CHABU|nr:hypothetical protein CBR_g25963 [Chara braunii]|eukprot:GBG78028.1 hypothetical protein CBR_g25963 [Chara braunii]
MKGKRRYAGRARKGEIRLTKGESGGRRKTREGKGEARENEATPHVTGYCRTQSGYVVSGLGNDRPNGKQPRGIVQVRGTQSSSRRRASRRDIEGGNEGEKETK